LAYAEALQDGASKRCADEAAIAAAEAAEQAGRENAAVRASLERGEVPPETLEYALATGRAAAKACMARAAAAAEKGSRDAKGLDLSSLSLEELEALGYDVRLLDERDEVLRKWGLAAADNDETRLLATLDTAFQPSKLGSLYDVKREQTLDVDRYEQVLPLTADGIARQAVVEEHVIQERLREREEAKREAECALM